MKILSKKFYMFGRIIPASLLALILVIGLASAGMVAYLSNKAVASVNIESPLAVWLDDGTTAHSTTISLGTVYAGEKFGVRRWTDNRANLPIDSYPITYIVSLTDWTGAELSSVIYKDASLVLTPEGIEILPMVYVVQDDGTLKRFIDGNWAVADKKRIKLFFDNNNDGIAQKYTFRNGEEWNDMIITTSAGISPGNYTLEACNLFDITASCDS